MRFDPNIKRKSCRKKRKTRKKKISTRGKVLDCLSKVPDTVCLRATALCAVHALAVYDRLLLMSSTFSHLQKKHAVNEVVGGGMKDEKTG